MIRLGGHLSAKDGLIQVVVAARALDYNVVQIMLGGQHDWKPYQVDEVVAQRFRNLTVGVDIYVHLPYIMNPCAGGRLRHLGLAIFRKYEALATALSAKALVIHPGFKKDLFPEEAYKNGLEFFVSALKDARIGVLVETDSGSKNGSAIGSLEFISRLVKDLGDPRVGMCLDTCHLYARGIDLWDQRVTNPLLAKYGKMIRLIHLNAPDIDVELGSYRDMHNSTIASFGKDSVSLIKKLAAWPMVLERRSLAIQNEDSAFVRAILQVGESLSQCIPLEAEV